MAKFRLYYASCIDVAPEKAFIQIEMFKKIFSKYNLEIYGAGWKDSPIITLDSSPEYKAVITSYDLRQIRLCDILLVVSDLKTFASGTFIEMEYARQLGLYIIFLSINGEHPKNIFIESMANIIIYSTNELEQLLANITK